MEENKVINEVAASESLNEEVKAVASLATNGYTLGDYTIAGLALFGAAMVVRGVWRLGKKGVAKAKAKIQEKKNAAASAVVDAPVTFEEVDE